MTFYLYDLLNRLRVKVESGEIAPDEKINPLSDAVAKELSWWNGAADQSLVNFNEPRPSTSVQNFFSDASKAQCAVTVWIDGVQRSYSAVWCRNYLQALVTERLG